jgi:hypothetical protein
MRLATFSPLPSGSPRPGLVLDGERVVDIPSALGASDDTSTLLGVIRAGDAMRDRHHHRQHRLVDLQVRRQRARCAGARARLQFGHRRSPFLRHHDFTSSNTKLEAVYCPVEYVFYVASLR